MGVVSTVPAAASDREVSERRRWAMLAVSTCAQAAASVAINGAAFLIPVLVHDRGLSLTQAGTLAALPLVGVLCTLLLWGAAVDRVGERLVLLAGLGGTALAGVGALLVDGTVQLGAALFLAGAFAASTSSASGRVVVGWFPPARRGLAMGIRQMAQPAGVGIAAVSIPVISAHEGITAALTVSPVVAALAAIAVALLVLDPPRPPRHVEHTANPYRQSSYLQRIHVASILLVVPQFLVWTYALVWLLDDRGWAPGRPASSSRAPSCSARSAGSPAAPSPTWSAGACARCAGSRSGRSSPWRCSASPPGSAGPRASCC
jgi:sugar phosphate permease